MCQKTDSALFCNRLFTVVDVDAMQAKRLIETHATPTLQETAFMLGFTEPTSFYRYFKRATGMTAKEYRDSTLSKKSIV